MSVAVWSANSVIGGKGSSTSLFLAGTHATSTGGNENIDLTGLGGTPTAALFWTTGATADGVSGGASLGIGFAVSASSRACVAMQSENGVGTSNTDRRNDNTKCITLLDTSASVSFAADLVSFSANQATINVTTAASGTLLNYLAFGGDVEASLIEIQSPASTGSQAYAHGLSGSPDALLAITSQISTSVPDTDGFSALGLGIGTSILSRCITVNGQPLVGSSSTLRLFSSNLITAVSSVSGSILDLSGTATVDATNINLSWPTADVTQRYCWILALRGLSAKLITGDQPATNSTVTRNIGFSPKAALALTAMAPSSASVEDDARIGIGVWTPGKQAFSGAVDEDGQATTDADSVQDSNELIKHLDHAQANVGSCSVAADGTDLDETWTDCDGTQREHSTIVFG